MAPPEAPVHGALAEKSGEGQVLDPERQGKINGLHVLLEQGRSIGTVRPGEEAGQSMRHDPGLVNETMVPSRPSMEAVNEMLDLMGVKSVVESQLRNSKKALHS